MQHRFERALTLWGEIVTRRPLVVIGGVVLATLLLATQLQYFTLDTSSESYYHEDDPVRLEYDAFRDVFGRDATILLAIRPEGGVFTRDALELLRSIVGDLRRGLDDQPARTRLLQSK